MLAPSPPSTHISCVSLDRPSMARKGAGGGESGAFLVVGSPLEPSTPSYRSFPPPPFFHGHPSSALLAPSSPHDEEGQGEGASCPLSPVRRRHNHIQFHLPLTSAHDFPSLLASALHEEVYDETTSDHPSPVRSRNDKIRFTPPAYFTPPSLHNPGMDPCNSSVSEPLTDDQSDCRINLLWFIGCPCLSLLDLNLLPPSCSLSHGVVWCM
jgi:hypothetical protein